MLQPINFSLSATSFDGRRWPNNRMTGSGTSMLAGGSGHLIKQSVVLPPPAPHSLKVPLMMGGVGGGSFQPTALRYV